MKKKNKNLLTTKLTIYISSSKSHCHNEHFIKNQKKSEKWEKQDKKRKKNKKEIISKNFCSVFLFFFSFVFQTLNFNRSNKLERKMYIHKLLYGSNKSSSQIRIFADQKTRIL